MDEREKNSIINNMVSIIKNWNSVYHPTENDYRRLAGDILEYLEKEYLISSGNNTDKKLER